MNRALSFVLTVMLVTQLVPSHALAEAMSEFQDMAGSGAAVEGANGNTSPGSGNQSGQDGGSAAGTQGEPTDQATPFEQSKVVDGVTITVKAPEGAFPTGADLRVEKTAAQEQAQVEKAVAAARDQGANVVASHTFDLKVCSADGGELQPANGSSVEISFSSTQVADPNLAAGVYQVAETQGADEKTFEAHRLDAAKSEDGPTVTVAADGLSRYAVDLTYAQLAHELVAGESVALADVLAAVGLTGEVQAASTSNTELLSTSNETGTWVVTASKPFGAAEQLKVTIAGVEYRIAVTAKANPEKADPTKADPAKDDPAKADPAKDGLTLRTESSDPFGPLQNGRYTLESKTYDLVDDYLAQGYIYVPQGVTATINLIGHNKLYRDVPTADEQGYVIKNDGTLTIFGNYTGSIQGGNAVNGGGIYNNGTLTIDRASVRDNKASNAGAGIYCTNSSRLILSQYAWVNYNSLTGENPTGGAGIHAAGSLSMAGAITVQDNTQGSEENEKTNNLYLAGSTVINVTGDISNSDIGVTPQNAPRKLTSGLSAAGNNISMFKLDDAAEGVTLVESGGELTATLMVNSWSALQTAINNAKSGEIILLSQTVTAGSGDKILSVGEDNNVVIDLNGFDINRNLGSTTDSGSVIFAGGRLTVRDSKGGGKICGGHARRGGGIFVGGSGVATLQSGAVSGNRSLRGGGVWVDGGGEFEMTGGSVDGNTASGDHASGGGGVFVGDGGAFSLKAGGVANNTTSGMGGGLFVGGSNGRFTTTGGAITGNTANGGGGGVAIDGIASISGCVITHNTTNASNGGGIFMGHEGATITVTNTKVDNNVASNAYGGGIYVNKGAVNVTDGSISGNTAKSGGGVMCYTGKTFTANGTVISNNKTTGSGDNDGGGGICSRGHLELTDVTLAGNTSSGRGGAVISFSVQGDAYSNSTAKISGGSITNNTAAFTGGGVCMAKTSGGFQLEGAPVIQQNNSIYDSDKTKDVYLEDKTINVVGTLADGARVGVSLKSGTGTFTTNYKAANSGQDPAQFFFADDNSLTPSLDAAGEAQLSRPSWKDLQAIIDQAADGDTIVLQHDWRAASNDVALTIPEGKHITIDLNGYTLDRALEGRSDDGQVFVVDSSAELTIQDSSERKSGKITGGYGSNGGGIYLEEDSRLNLTGGSIAGNTALNGGGVYLSHDCELNISGGRIEKNTAEKGSSGNNGHGGGVYANYAKVTMAGGSVSSNTADGRGGGFLLYNGNDDQGSPATITGGSISDNTATRGGGLLLSNQTLHLYGGSITGNTASERGGGISIDSSRFNVKGAPVVKSNTSPVGKNVYLLGNAKINVVDVLTSTTADMGVSLEHGAGTFTTGFKSHNPGREPGSYFFASDDGCTVTKDLSGEGYVGNGWTMLQQMINDAANGSTITLDRDYKAMEGDIALIVAEGKEVTIDLNGHTIDRNAVEIEGIDENDQTIRYKRVESIDANVFVVRGTLTVMDGSEKQSGKITGGHACDDSVYGHDDPGRTNGGGICNYGTLNIRSGNITGNEAINGGGIANYGTLNVSGGTISGNDAYEYGGGVSNRGTMTFTGGTISDNRAQSGGGVYNAFNGGGSIDVGAILNMSGGTIATNNARENGGGICCLYNTGGSAVNLTGGSISGNVALKNGGAMHVMSMSVATIGGECSMKNNTAMTGSGGAIYVTMGTLNLQGGEISYNRAGDEAGGIKVGDTYDQQSGHENAVFNISGSPVVGANSALRGNNIVLYKDKVFHVMAPLSSDARLDFTTENIPRKVTSGLNASAESDIKPRFSYNDGKGDDMLSIQEGELYVGAQADVWVSDWKGLQAAVNNATAGQVIGLDKDITAADDDVNIVVENKDVVIELAGHTLDRGLAKKDPVDTGHVIKVGSGGTLTLRDSGGVGRVTGGNAKTNGGGIYVESGGSLVVQSGIVTGNKATKDGGGIYVSKPSTLAMTGGTIANNTAGGSGGGIHTSGKSTIQGSYLTGNTAGNGGGLCGNTGGNDDTDHVSITDTKIDGNTSTNGGGIYLQSGKVTLAGGTVSDNTANAGGGIHVTRSAILEAEATHLVGNEAIEGSGGGVLAQGSSRMRYCHILNNKARSGGGLCVSADVELLGPEIKGSAALAGNGGGIDVESGKLTLDGGDYGGVVTGNRASSKGSGIYVAKGAHDLDIADSPKVIDNGSSDVYLSSGRKLNVSSNIQFSEIGVALEDNFGVFTKNYTNYEPNPSDPATIFTSNRGYDVVSENGDAAIRKPEAKDESSLFIKYADQIVDSHHVDGSDWMSAISGERFLSEINIPYTHDSAMRDAYAYPTSSLGAYLGFGKNAKTQRRYIDEQLVDGVRMFDLRLNNSYCHVGTLDKIGFVATLGGGIGPAVALANGFAGTNLRDDGENLYLSHGKNAIGSFWGLNHDGDQVTLAEILGWMEDFLTKHPSETIAIEFGVETTDNAKNEPKVIERLRKHLAALYTKTNPSTGRSYVYTEPGTSGPFEEYTHIPQLKDCRGQIVLIYNEDLENHPYGGFKNPTGGLSKQTLDGSTSESAGQKIKHINEFFDTHNEQLPTDVSTHPDHYYQISTNSKADSFTDIMDSDMEPLAIAGEVHSATIGTNRVIGDTLGRMLGWVKMDGATPAVDEAIWRTNFFDGLQYCTVTAESGLGKSEDTQVYRLLKNTTITIPECIYDNPNASGDSFTYWKALIGGDARVCYPGDTFTVSDDVTFVAQWNYDFAPHKHSISHVYAKDATCTEDGNKEYWVCDAGEEPCHRTFSDAAGTNAISRSAYVIPATGHDWGAPSYVWSADNTQVTATRVCTRDPRHTESETVGSTAEVIKVSTCTETGTTVYSASFNNAAFSAQTKTVTTPAKGHVATTPARENEVDPTCTTVGGYDSVIRCKTCNVVLSSEHMTRPALGHDWGEWTEVKAASESEEGVEQRVCTRVDTHVETRPIAMTGHTHQWDEGRVTTEPTCTTKGVKTYTCTIDHNHTRTEAIEALKHKYEWIERKAVEPTCDTVGYTFREHRCSVCGDSDEGEMVWENALGHNWDAPTYAWRDDNATVTGTHVCKRDGTHQEEETARAEATVKGPTCTEAGAITYTARFTNAAFTEQSKTVATPAKGHMPGQAVHENVVAPTCTQQGTYDSVTRCATCGTELTRTHEKTSPIGHAWGEWTVTREATETELGEEQRVCSRDETHVETRVIPAKGHVHALTKVEAKAPTCTEDGNIEHWVCSGGEDPCGLLFSSQTGENELSVAETILKATGHAWGEWAVTREATADAEGEERRVCANDATHVETRAIAKVEPEKPVYRNVSGDVTWTRGSSEGATMSFKRNFADETTFDHFAGVAVDGVEVPESGYGKERGSVIVTLTPAYLETLSTGEHTIAASFDDGDPATAKLTVADREGPDDGKDSGTNGSDTSGSGTSVGSNGGSSTNGSGTSVGSNGGSGSGASGYTSYGSGTTTGTSGSVASGTKSAAPATGDPTIAVVPVALCGAGLVLIGRKRRRR